MTPEELEAFRGWCRISEVPPHSSIMKALEHIDQQATALDEAEALTRRNVELMNGYLTRIAKLERDLAATEKRVQEHEVHENQTHEALGKILGTDDTLKNVAERAVSRIAELEKMNAELEARLGHEQVVTMQNREAQLQGYIRDLEAQVAALQEIAEWERASRLRDQVDYETDDEMMSEFCRDARRQLAKEHPEAFR